MTRGQRRARKRRRLGDARRMREAGRRYALKHVGRDFRVRTDLGYVCPQSGLTLGARIFLVPKSERIAEDMNDWLSFLGTFPRSLYVGGFSEDGIGWFLGKADRRSQLRERLANADLYNVNGYAAGPF